LNVSTTTHKILNAAGDSILKSGLEVISVDGDNIAHLSQLEDHKSIVSSDFSFDFSSMFLYQPSILNTCTLKLKHSVSAARAEVYGPAQVKNVTFMYPLSTARLINFVEDFNFFKSSWG